MLVRKLLRNALGISMVEVMMAVAISGGMALTIAKLMENSNQNIKQVEAKSEKLGLENIIISNFTTPAACFNTFNPIINSGNITTLSGSTSASITVPSIKDRGNNILYDTNSKNILPLTITGMTLTNYSPTNKTGDLVVSLTFRRSSSQVQSVKPMNIKINFNLNGSNALVACSPMEAGGGEWLLAGNAGTVDGTDFFGTTDNQPLNFKVNSQKAGRISSTGETYFGYRAGNSMTSGVNNTIIGANALFTGTTTVQNTTAIGANSLYSTTATGNTAIGNSSMYRDTTGQDNVAVGHQTLYNNTTGNSNVALGIQTLYNNTTAHNNTAVGTVSLFANTTGAGNTGLGQQSLYMNTTGSQNTAIGQYASRSSTTPNSNTSVGSYSLYTNVSGGSNTALGTQAGYFNSSGSFNTYVGASAGQSLATGSNNVLIGYNAGAGVVNSSNKLYIEASGNTTPLIGGNFSARTINLAGTTTFDVGAWGISMKVPSTSAIRTTTASASDKIYFDSRTLFRDGASGDNGFVGIAGGLGVGGGSYWDGTVVPAEGNVQIEGEVGIGTQTLTAAKLTVNGTPSGSATTVRINNTSNQSGLIGLHAQVDHGGFGNWSTAINATNYSTNNPGSYTVGIRASASQATYNGDARMYGGWFSAGNGNTGHNYAIIAQLGGDTAAGSRGTAIWAAANNEWPQNINTDYSPLNTRWAGVFVGPVHITGISYASTHTNTSDRRLKKDIKPLKSSLEKILKLQGVSYNWKEDKNDMGEQIGLIAQDVQEIYPQVVTAKKKEEGMKSLNYSGLIAPIIESIKELYQMVLNLIKTDSRHDEEIKALKIENEKLKQQMQLQQESFDQRMKRLEANVNKKK